MGDADDEDYYYLKMDHEHLKTTEIMNYIMLNSYYVNDFSTNELNRIISYSGFNKTRCLSLLEEFTKEELEAMIDKFDTEQANYNKKKKPSIDILPIMIKKEIIKRKFINVNFPKLNGNAITHERAWEFLTNLSSIVDIRELLLNHDHQKLMKKVKDINVKDNKKINDLCDNFFQERIKKIREVIQKAGSIEDNDHYFLKHNDHGLEIKSYNLTGFPSINYSSYGIKNSIIGDLSKFESCFFKINDNLKSYMLKFLDIFSVAKLGLVNKKFYKFAYKQFDLEKLAKSTCVAIFKTSKIYNNDNKLLKNTFSNYLSMLVNR